MTMTGKLVHEETPEDWDNRFAGTGGIPSWNSSGGCYQSLLFAFHALAHVFQKIRPPEWSFDPETAMVSYHACTIHDYGCALGDGTALIQAAFPTADVTGFDHSPRGVEIASERWPNMNFEVGDVNAPQKDADVIWTSHCLEHVQDPAEAILGLLKRCRYLVVVVPPITTDRRAEEFSHEGAEDIREWLKRVPEPEVFHQYRTLRDAEPEPLVEGQVLLMWRGDLE